MKNVKRTEYAILGIILLLFNSAFLIINQIQTNLNNKPFQGFSGLKPSNSEWSHFKMITLTPSTPASDYQVRIDLNPTNFDYFKANPDGSDLRFYDLNKNKLNYWIEKWDPVDTSIIWVKIPTSGTSNIYMKYGNPLAISESNGTKVFMLFDDFDGTSLDLNLWDIDDDGYSSVTVSDSEVRIFSNAPGSWYQTADFGFHTMWVEHGATYGYHGDSGGAMFIPTEDINFTGDLHWVNETWAPYFEDDVYHSSDTAMEIGTRPVRFMAHTGYPGPGTHFGAYISSDDDTLGQANRRLRIKGWYDITGPSEIRLDWVAVGKWYENNPEASVGLEYIISEWKYFNLITLTPSTPASDYQVRIDLNLSNFDYSKANPDGSDLRFYDIDKNKLNYWIEKWDPTDTSTIWVKIPTSGTSSIYMEYGNPLVTSESNGTNVFMLFDDFNDPLLDTNIWEYEDDGYSSISISSSVITLYTNSPSPWASHALLGFHSAYILHGQDYGFINYIAGASYCPSEDIWVTGDFRWENESFASYYENDIYLSNDSEITESSNPVRFLTHSTYGGPGLHYGAMISTLNTSLGVPNRALRVKTKVDLSGLSEIMLDWAAVRKWSKEEPESSIGSEYIISEWNYAKLITLTPSTPASDYQVRIDLNLSNFDYSKANPDGSDLRFYDLDKNKLNYWIEKWDPTDTSTIWVKIPTSGTSSIYMEYGNPLATSESNGTNVFMLFDDFNDPLLDTNVWEYEDDGYSSISISSSVITLYTNSPSPWASHALLGFHSAYILHGQDYGFINYIAGASYTPSEDIWVTGDFRWENESFASYYENDMYLSNDSEITESSNPVRFLTHSTYSGPGLHYGAMISTLNTSLGVPNRALRVKTKIDLSGLSEIMLDWAAVRKWSKEEPVSNVGSEYKIYESPEIIITSPISNEFFGYDAPSFEISFNKPLIKETWYTIDNGPKIPITTSIGSINQTEWNLEGDGPVIISFYAKDNGGLLGHTEVTVYKDTIAPLIIINEPDSDFFGVTSPDFDLTINDLNIDARWYNLNNGDNITFTANTGTVNQTKWEMQGDGSVIINFYVNDTGGLFGHEEVTVYKDTTAPVSSIYFIPHSGINIVNKSTTFTLNAADGTGSGVSIKRYKINDSDWFDYSVPFDLSNYEPGYYLISYYSVDNVGNNEIENSIEVILLKEPSKLPDIPGFETFLIIGIIGMVSIALFKMRYKILNK